MTLTHPTRAAGLERLAAFVPHAGRAYASARNFDTGARPRGNVSELSPYLRHRLLTEQEVVAAVLQRHSLAAAEKFIQEVCWRTYWKGWLELHPSAWHNFTAALAQQTFAASKDKELAARLAAAESGTTGIDCFDAWATELVNTGYVHNHARMWFASIWIYTLRLPWELGADFFMRHLLDGDPASNTLSWRWVCGLQTAGKTYLARADNIARYTEGRFNPHGQLASHAPPLTEQGRPSKAIRLPPAITTPISGSTALIMTEDDLQSESWGVGPGTAACLIGLRTAKAYPGVSAQVIAFKQAALANGVARAQAYFSCPVLVLPVERDKLADALIEQAEKTGAQSFTLQHMPAGPTRDSVVPILKGLTARGWPVRTLQRDWDSAFWPHATHGFFRLREHIPRALAELALEAAPELPF